MIATTIPRVSIYKSDGFWSWKVRWPNNNGISGGGYETEAGARAKGQAVLREAIKQGRTG